MSLKILKIFSILIMGLIVYILLAPFNSSTYYPKELQITMNKYKNMDTFKKDCPYQQFEMIAIKNSQNLNYRKCKKWLNSRDKCVLVHNMSETSAYRKYQIDANFICSKQLNVYLKERAIIMRKNGDKK